MKILTAILLSLILVSSTLAMSEAEFVKVKVNDIVFLDFSKYSSVPSITGKVIDKGTDWAAIYQVKSDGYWSCTRWNKYYITSITIPAPANNDQEVIQLRQEIAILKAKINGLIMQIMELVR